MTAEELAEKVRALAEADAKDIADMIDREQRDFERTSAAWEARAQEIAQFWIKWIREHYAAERPRSQ